MPFLNDKFKMMCDVCRNVQEGKASSVNIHMLCKNLLFSYLKSEDVVQ